MFPGTQQRPVQNLSLGKPEQILAGTQGTAPTEDKLRCEMGRAHKDTHCGGRESAGPDSGKTAEALEGPEHWADSTCKALRERIGFIRQEQYLITKEQGDTEKTYILNSSEKSND